MELEVRRSELLQALDSAISTREQYKDANGFFTDSGILAYWKLIQNALRRGDNIKVVDIENS